MAYTTINKSSLNFNTKPYTGNGGTNAQTGINFKPDLTWIKNRTASGEGHHLYDVVRGVTKRLRSDTSAAESTVSTGLTAFGTDGFTVGNTAGVNGNGNGIASWNWKAGSSFSNSAGANGASIASTGSINTTAGFSIISYTGSGSNATVAHGLGVVPKMILFKNRQATNSWRAAHNSIGWNKSLFLDNANSAQTEAYYNNTAPTNQVFSIGSDGGTNGNNNNIIALCFAEKTGYSKINSFVGNSSENGTFCYCGFKPSFVILKSSTSSEEWVMFDNKRLGFNPDNNALIASSNSTEATDNDIDFTAQGFKLRRNTGYVNDNGKIYIYMAFGQSIVGSNNIPATAR